MNSNRELELLALELSIESMGIYPAAINNVKRSEWQDGWNAAVMAVTEQQFVISKWLSDKPKEVIDLLEKETLSVDLEKDDNEKFQIRIFVNCSDIFAWGCADGEEIKEDEIDDLLAALKESPEHGDILWIARKRGMRPQGAIYSKFSEEEAALFNAVGEKRKVGFGNPYDNIPGDNNEYAIQRSATNAIKDSNGQ